MKRIFSASTVYRVIAYGSVASLAIFGVASKVAAIEGGSSKPIQSPLPIGAVSVPVFIGRVINGFIGVSGVVALIIFIYSGFMMMTAQGNSDKFNQGKKSMMWAGIGLVAVFASYAVIRFVIEGVGADTFSG